MTAWEYNRGAPGKKKEEDEPDDKEGVLNEDGIHELNENLWYIRTEKLESAEARAKLIGMSEAEGFILHMKIYKLYSAVTGVARSDRPRQTRE
eukprot:2888954-Pyramimonas_sp.AAC.1